MLNKLNSFIRNRKIRKEGGAAFSQTIREYFKKEHGIIVGYGTYGGCFNSKNIPKGTTFGNYCSIAPDIRIFRANHPKEYFTLHPLFYNPSMGFVSKDLLHRPEINIGHDVWIGEWTVILPNVNEIGNGAIIGAGSVVTKNVPAYSIVAGNPAKVIGMRFNEEIINKLENTKWWNWDKEKLFNNKEVLENIVNNG